ncbi:type I-G CRISPR-associated protein Cas8g2 [Planctomicrobium sp. SH664]|uniref:type I-G CRISPR-associated protein Cas8g2 n=1 Tax=Planctomicrobium sp. SH664 TaxID=3448125 RepID=UPI003F5C10F4
MIQTPATSLRMDVDLANPGQFFACCGLLELADRIWKGAEGWFENHTFHLRPVQPCENVSGEGLLRELAGCRLTNSMSPEDIIRLEELSALSGKVRSQTPGLDDEKALLEKKRREEPILLLQPFNIQIDWFRDSRSGGSRYKTWAGQQSVLDIATSMKQALATPDWLARPPGDWFFTSSTDCGLPFNFDSDLGGQGSGLDVGFSFDPLAASALTRIEPSARPGLEFFAFVGLQRFRPRQFKKENRFRYRCWNVPFTPQIASVAACGELPVAGETFEFRLLYRTKYLKSFLPAVPFTGEINE